MTNNLNILTIIPARGGSKGIYSKNIQLVGGLPLLAWNIKAAKGSKYINRIVVSTDDIAIANVAKKYGGEYIWRPSDISGDTASSESALLHVLETLNNNEGYLPNLIVFLQCTSPLTSSKDIDNCIEKLINENADCATTVTNFHYYLWKKNEDGTAEGINHDKNYRSRRQDREPQYLETGAVYVMRTEGFLKHKHRFFGKTVVAEMPAERVHEIDEPIDLIIADIRLRALNSNMQQLFLPEEIKAVIFDFDGVMTDNKVYVSETGNEMVLCDRGDGMGISQLKNAGFKVAVMSTETNSVVTARCNKLGIECYQCLGHSKHEVMIDWCKSNEIELISLLYMGNDINDIECMKLAGCAIAPVDAFESVKPFAQILLKNGGGKGAVRELCDMIMKNKL